MYDGVEYFQFLTGRRGLSQAEIVSLSLSLSGRSAAVYDLIGRPPSAAGRTPHRLHRLDFQHQMSMRAAYGPDPSVSASISARVHATIGSVADYQ